MQNLKDSLGVQINDSNCLIFAVQEEAGASSVVAQYIANDPLLANFKVVNDGCVLAGVPTGRPEFVRAHLDSVIKELHHKFQPLLKVEDGLVFFHLVKRCVKTSIGHRLPQVIVEYPKAFHQNILELELFSKYLDIDIRNGLDFDSNIDPRQPLTPQAAQALAHCSDTEP